MKFRFKSHKCKPTEEALGKKLSSEFLKVWFDALAPTIPKMVVRSVERQQLQPAQVEDVTVMLYTQFFTATQAMLSACGNDNVELNPPVEIRALAEARGLKLPRTKKELDLLVEKGLAQ